LIKHHTIKRGSLTSGCLNLHESDQFASRPVSSGHEIVQCATDLKHLYSIYSIPTHDKHQWLLLQFIVLLKVDAKGVRNM